MKSLKKLILVSILCSLATSFSAFAMEDTNYTKEKNIINNNNLENFDPQNNDEMPTPSQIIRTIENELATYDQMSENEKFKYDYFGDHTAKNVEILSKYWKKFDRRQAEIAKRYLHAYIGDTISRIYGIYKLGYNSNPDTGFHRLPVINDSYNAYDGKLDWFEFVKTLESYKYNFYKGKLYRKYDFYSWNETSIRPLAIKLGNLENKLKAVAQKNKGKIPEETKQKFLHEFESEADNLRNLINNQNKNNIQTPAGMKKRFDFIVNILSNNTDIFLPYTTEYGIVHYKKAIETIIENAPMLAESFIEAHRERIENLLK